MNRDELTELARSAPHERYFAEFAKNEKTVGGPDPQIALVGQMAEECEWADRAWMVACYAAVYNVPGGYVLWKNWPWQRILAEPEALPVWIKDNWEGIPFRRERRAVRSVDKLSRCLLSAATWLTRAPHEDWWAEPDYDAAWRAADQVYGFGRYVNLKFLEALRRYCGMGAELKDLRAAGGWSPRASLVLLYPRHAGALLGGDTAQNCAIADMCAGWARETLAERYGVLVTPFETQVLLCEYRESYISRRQFPGRSHDSELKHAQKAAAYWGEDDAMYQARAAIFPHKSLGEIQGWDRVREELGAVLRDAGYVWSDLRFDYLRSRDDLAHPVEW